MDDFVSGACPDQLLMLTVALTALPFAQAALVWLKSREPHLAPRTFVDYSNYIKTLSSYFGEMLPQEITSDQVRAYQHMRLTRAGPNAINKELGVLVQLRNRIGIPLRDYQRLPQRKEYESPGRALEEHEEARLIRVFTEAADHKSWDLAALVSLLSMFSGMGPGEIRSLKLKHCSLHPPCVIVPRAGAKRHRRERPVMLGETGAWALDKLLARAKSKCGAVSPDHYLVPFRNRDHSYDPTRPASACAWREGIVALLELAGIKLRPYDFRHHAASKALQNPQVSLEGAKAHFGWISPKMIQRYYHANLATLKVVAAAIDKKPAQFSHSRTRKRA